MPNSLTQHGLKDGVQLVLITGQNEPGLSQAHASIKPLRELEPGQAGPIVSIQMNTPELSQELTAMGIAPNAVVRMVANHRSSFLFRIERKEFAADKEIASGIWVRTLG